MCTAGMQGVANPCPRVVHPVWLTRMLNEASTGMKQAKISSMFAAITNNSASNSSKNKGIGLIGTKLVSTVIPPTGSGGTTSILKAGQSPTRAHYSPSRLQSPAMNRKRSLLGDLPSDSPGTGTGLSFPILGSDVGVVGGGDMEDLFGKDGRGTGGKAIAHFKLSSSTSGAERRSVSFDLSTDLANTTAATDIQPPRSTSTSLIIHPQTQPQTQVQTASPAITTLQSEDEFNHWLKSRTNTWRTLRSDRKQELKRWANYRNTSSFSTSSMNPLLDQILIKKPLGVADYVRNASLAITHGIWQIIELQEMDTPGEYTAWVMIFGQTPSSNSTSSSTIQKIKIIVPRVLYINCLSKQAEENAVASYGTKVVRKLPHGHTSHALYEVELPEHK